MSTTQEIQFRHVEKNDVDTDAEIKKSPSKSDETFRIVATSEFFQHDKVPAHIISNGSTVRNGSVDSTCFQKSISTGQCPVKLRGLKMKEIVTPSQRVSFKMPKRPRLDNTVCRN